ncbi:beta-ketoacyl-ACP synthase [Pseudenhygromyxa sp. WMMC2535]|uniref:beta-ketoacyl-ACP synthase n=1 Tax=Pseudenhygromyxa sp. WMMC2535 TaxID=2712867 RepID=UPI001551D8BF|nr:beta-ketoacyl-ACP synthase [Pseudenhygromyxa sp. WMMC2535]NVB42507.1 beta-ketoacyl-ACP synthase [Pseudenhygromyxa sp. WMMC2535]
MRSGVPITAYSACNGLGQHTEAVLDGLFAGRRGLRPAESSYGVSTWLGAVPEPLPALMPAVARFEGRQARIAQLATLPLLDAVEAAKSRWGAERVALIVGTSTAGIADSERAWIHHREHGRLPEGYDIARQHAIYACVQVIRSLTGVTGPGYAVSSACSSSGKVFASALRLMRAGIVDAAVVGGVDSLCQMTVRGFAGLEVLSADPCRPFSSERQGINIGEGAGLLLLEREAPAGGGTGVSLLGVGESSDAHHMTAPHPEGLGARMAMARALDMAGVPAREVDQINVHGTGTIKNDETEARAIRELFAAGQDSLPRSLAVVATKGYTGHMLGAAGATEAIFACATIERGQLPASVGADPIDPSLGVELDARPRDRASRRVLSNSLAFGGSNVSVLLGAEG